MKKVIVCLTGVFLLTLGGLRAQSPAVDTTGSIKDSASTAKDTANIMKDTSGTAKDTTHTVKDTTIVISTPNKDTISVAVTVPQDTATKQGGSQPSQSAQPSEPQDSTAREENPGRQLDTR